MERAQEQAQALQAMANALQTHGAHALTCAPTHHRCRCFFSS